MFVIDPSRPILVYLANGVQGGAVVRAALRRGFKVRAIVRNRARSGALAALGVELAEGDLDDAASLRAASADVAHAVIQIPVGPEAQMRARAENALSASRTCALTSVVLKLASASRPAPCAEPSFVANAMIEGMVRKSGLPFAIVRPTLYLDNLLKPSARAEILEQGVFAPPIAASQRIAWTSADDCAEASVTLLEQGVHGGDHRIAGPDSLTGDELAERIAAGLGRSVIYRAQPLDEFERDIDAAMGPGSGHRVASRFRYLATHPHEAEAILAAPFEAQSGLEHFRPSDVETWVRQHRKDFLESPGTTAA